LIVPARQTAQWERQYDVDDNLALLELSDVQGEELQGWAQSRSLPAGDVFRARIILPLADGALDAEPSFDLGIGPTVTPTSSGTVGLRKSSGM
jgi:hypothetical protein